MNVTLKKLSPALVAPALVLSWAMGYGTAARLQRTSDRPRVAAIASERDHALADLMDSRKRHQGACRSIERYREELAAVDKENEQTRSAMKAVCAKSIELATELGRVADANAKLQEEVDFRDKAIDRLLNQVEFLQCFAPF